MSLQWSRYNYQYPSEKHGNILFNAITNKLALVNADFMETLDKVREQPDKAEELLDKEVLDTLLDMKVLLNEGDEEFHFLQRRHWRYMSRYGNKHSLGLTIAPTTACNFRCTYCFEGEKENHMMSDETADRLVSFVKDSPNNKSLSVSWFGGEPLMQFRRICELTERFKELLPEDDAYNAGMITNGYLLTKEKVDKLDELYIKAIQITIDGMEDSHDQRRPHKSGGKTFSTIMENIDYLLSAWDGSLVLRSNVYPGEIDKVKELNSYLKERFSSHKNIPKAYPGFIHDLNDKYPTATHCSSPCSDDIGSMLLEMERHETGRHIDMLYPSCRVTGCVATGQGGFVIGPRGEIYKCWDDLGEESRIVGFLSDEDKNWHNEKLAVEYILGSDSFDDPECRKCFFVHICDGGCAKVRQLRKYEGKNIPSPCISMKGHIKEVLDYICDNINFGNEINSMLFETGDHSPGKLPIKCLN